MAYERYIDKDSKLYIVLHRWHSVVELRGELHTSPTTVDVLLTWKEECVTVKHVDFELKVSGGELKRVPNI